MLLPFADSEHEKKKKKRMQKTCFWRLFNERFLSRDPNTNSARKDFCIPSRTKEKTSIESPGKWNP